MHPSKLSALPVRLRPAERVRRFIQELEQRCELPEGRLPTIRELAEHLSVSLATVQTVYRELKDEGRITTRTGDGTFLTSYTQPKRDRPPKQRIYIYRTPDMKESISLRGDYYGALLQTFANSRNRLDISFLNTEQPAEQQVRELYQSGEMDGLLIFPFVPCQPLFDTCDELSVPYVSIHQPNAFTTSNFVAPDFFKAGVQIGEAIRQQGRKRVLFVTYGKLLPSTSAWAVVSGISVGALAANSKITLEMITVLELRKKEKSYIDWLNEHRDNLPDVIIHQYANLAQQTSQFLSELGRPAPESACIINTLTSGENIESTIPYTRFAINCTLICEEALKMLQRRIELNGQSLPGIKVPIGFTGGATTTPLENRILNTAKLNTISLQ